MKKVFFETSKFLLESENLCMIIKASNLNLMAQIE